MAEGFASIPKTQAELDNKLERMRAWMRSFFIPNLQQNQGTMETAPDGGPVVAPYIQLWPKQEGSRMPQVDRQELRKRQYQQYYGVGGGPA